MNIYIYIYMCVCVYVSKVRRFIPHSEKTNKHTSYPLVHEVSELTFSDLSWLFSLPSPTLRRHYEAADVP